jgi:microcystin-dependent protein
MSEPFLAEIKIVGFNFAPRGWAFCDGQLLPINQNPSLFSLLGTTYGGDGRTNFQLPDLRGRVPIHPGQPPGGTLSFGLGQKDGEETHSLSVQEMPNHTHTMRAVGVNANSADPTGRSLARASVGTGNIYKAAAAYNQTLDSAAVTTRGAGQGHENMQPFLTLSFCIALQGLFPSRN